MTAVDALSECLASIGDLTDLAGCEHAWVEAEKVLSTDGHAYFMQHPREDRAPYAVFVSLAGGVSKPWKLVVCVGQKQIDLSKQTAYAEICSGQLARNIVRRHAG